MDIAYGQTIDYVIVVVYFVIILGFGSLFGRYTKSTKDFFFSGQRFSWWLIAFSCVATVVGSYSFIKYAAAGYRYGFSSTMSYLNDWFLVPLFMLGWLPIIYYSRVTSIPEYFEKRFGRSTRVMAVIFILVYLTGYIGINLYTLGVAMNAIIPTFGVFEWAAIIAVIAAIYVTFGGQTAVIMTDLAQGFLLLGAGVLLLVLGFIYLGQHNGQGLDGLTAFWQGLPVEHRLPFSGFSSPERFPMVGIFWQDLFGSSMFFYFANQGLIMRFLAVKSVAEGRKAIIVVALFLMPLAALSVGNAGWIGRAMATFGLIPEDTEPNQIFMVVAELVAQPGVFGLILAALTAALMSTVDTLINAVSAIAVNDIWKPFLRPGRDDKHYLAAARVFSIVFTIAGLGLVPLYMTFESIYVAHGAFTAAISPPIIVVVVLGVLWKRYSSMAAFLTLLVGGALVGISLQFPELIRPLASIHGMEPGTGYNYMRALYGFIVCSAVGVGASFLWPQKDFKRIEGLWVGTLGYAKFLFKGSRPNDDDLGEKIWLKLERDDTAAEDDDGSAMPVVTMSTADAQRMLAKAGDIVYVADKRWWLGGLRSLHARLAIADDVDGTVEDDSVGSSPYREAPKRPDGAGGTIVIRLRDIEDARLTIGEIVRVEKII